MAIKITAGTSLPTQTEKQIKYRDVFLDLGEEGSSRKSHFAKDTKTDLKTSVDEGAIVNSIRNIFSTSPGERVLEPDFGLNLKQWLFQPLDDFTAREIGETILQGIERYEPRVSVNTINVNTAPEKHEYHIKLVLTVPSLNINSKAYEAILSQPGFDILSHNTI